MLAFFSALTVLGASLNRFNAFSRASEGLLSRWEHLSVTRFVAKIDTSDRLPLV